MRSCVETRKVRCRQGTQARGRAARPDRRARWLVEHEQIGVVGRRAERESLHHPRERGHPPLRVPEAEASEQHPDSLRRSTPGRVAAVRGSARSGRVEETRRVADPSPPGTIRAPPEAARGRRRGGSCVSGAVRSADDEKPAARKLEIHAAEDALGSVPLLQPPRLDHAGPPTCPQGIPRIPEESVAREVAKL